jgi:hypothetical protein
VTADYLDSLIDGVAHLEADIVIVLRVQTPDYLKELSQLKEQREQVPAVLGRRTQLQPEFLTIVHHSISVVLVESKVTGEQLSDCPHNGGNLVFLPTDRVDQLLFRQKGLISRGLR